MRRNVLRALPVLLGAALLALAPSPEAALAATPAQVDAQALGAQTLRPYWHVFAAFAVAWLLIFGWLFSVARRLARIERKLGG